MRKRDLWKRAIVTGATAAALFSNMTVLAAGEHDGRLTDRADHTDKDFDEYEYERMDEADFDAIIDGLDELVQDTANADKVLDVIVGMEDYYCEASRNYSIAHIKSDLVADDQYWDDEVMFWDDLTTNIGDKIMTSYNVIATSPNADVLHERVDDEDDWQDILDYTVMTQEQKDLSAKETELSLKYDVLYNKEYTTKVNGKDYTEDELAGLRGDGTLDSDGYNEALADLMQQKNQERAELYLELVDVRTQIARSYGYSDFAEYAYDKRYGRDYTTAELDEYREQVKNNIVPLQDELMMELYGTYYSDLMAMFNQGMTDQECLDTLRQYLPEISSDLLVSLDYMEDHHLYDLSISDEKAPGGYTISIGGYNAPFIYNCADGSIQDMETLIHEFGHYNEMYYMTADSWYYDEGNLDLAEIHSQGLELLFMDYAEDIYGDYADVMKLYTLFNLTYAAVEGCKEDAFQYEVYKNADNLTVEKLNQMYYDCCVEYSGKFGSMMYDSIGMGQGGYLPEKECYEWIDIPHTFQSPMYYISYSVSVAAVFELFDVILDDRDEGIDCYLALVDSEYQQEFQETLENVGLNNPIKNPRFDLYADDIKYAVGLVDERTVVDNYDPHIATTYWGEGGEAITHEQDGDPDPDEGTEPTTAVEPDETPDDDGDEDQAPADKDREEGDSRKTIALVVALGMIGLALVIIIVVIVKVSKSKKAQQGTVQNRAVNAPNPYMNQGMNNAQNMQAGGGNPYAANGGGNIPQQPINPYMQQGQGIAPAQNMPAAGTQMPLAGNSTDISSANILNRAESSINPYVSQSSINPYAGQSVQINPYANQTPNPYLQNLQAMQTQATEQNAQMVQAAAQSSAQMVQNAAQSAEQAQNLAANVTQSVAGDAQNSLRQIAERIPAEQRAALAERVRQGDKITTIRDIREMTGASLADAKAIVDAFENFLL
ncbi:MAG: hypothetical protein IKQ27_13285 [Lachnospiraceae bacterium]|nr:hypothetical protein [Lachnospiraceae bacterium]